MKKIIGIAALLLAIVLLGGPFYAGFKAERELHKVAAKFDSYPGYQVSWQSYERGWFSTEAVLAIGLEAALWPGMADGTQPESQAKSLPSLPLVIQIDHGPLLLNDISTFGWYSWQLELTQDQTAWLEEHIDAAGEGQLYESHGHAGLLGAVAFEDELKAFSVRDNHGGILVHTNGYVGSGTISSAGKLSYAGLVKGVDLTAEDALVVLGDITLRTEGDLSRMDWDSFIYPSNFYVNLTTVQVQGGDQEISLTNAVFEGAVEIPEGENWFDLIVSLSVGSLVADEMRMDDAAMTFAYEHISLDAYSAYMDMAAAALEAPEQKLDFQQFLTPQVMQQFLANGPAFALRNLSFTMPDGTFTGSIRLAVNKDAVPPGAAANPLLLVQAITLQAGVTVDQPLALYLAEASARAQVEAAGVEGEGSEGGGGEEVDGEAIDDADVDAATRQQAQDKLDMLIAQGILVSNGKTLEAKLQFANGQFLLNGRPIPLPLGLLMGATQKPGQAQQL